MVKHWADRTAEALINKYKDIKVFVLAGGISPSGTIHIGNFRDIITPEIVGRALKDNGKNVRLIFSWDDYDRFRKVPSNVDSKFEKYLGLPYSKVPDPFGCHKSYAEHFEKEFEEHLPTLGINPEFLYQTKLYESGIYNKSIVEAMNKRKKIAEILFSFKSQEVTQEAIDNYYPLNVYCEECNKDDGTKIIKYEKNVVTYECTCGYLNEVNILKKCIGKLSWKVDWAMRWRHENVCYEPGGRDHASAGGSYQVSSKIAREVFNIEPPIFQGYDFIGIRGLTTKMSGSTGINVSPKKLLEIYEPSLLRWLFVRTSPSKSFNFCFDTEIIRQYDEFDEQKKKFLKGELNEEKKRELEFSKVNNEEYRGDDIPFRQIANFGEITQGNIKEIKRILADLNLSYNEESIIRRLKLSHNWIHTYAKNLIINLRSTPNKEYFEKLSDEEKQQVIRFFYEFEKHWNLEDMTTFVYAIPRDDNLLMEENKVRQRNFFRNIYQLLIDKDTGPRLPTLIMAIGKSKVKKLSVV